jgi:hypothetical protein
MLKTFDSHKNDKIMKRANETNEGNDKKKQHTLSESESILQLSDLFRLVEENNVGKLSTLLKDKDYECYLQDDQRIEGCISYIK